MPGQSAEQTQVLLSPEPFPMGHVAPKLRSGHGSEATVLAAVGGIGPGLSFAGPVRGSDSAVPRGPWDRDSLLLGEKVSTSRAGVGAAAGRTSVLVKTSGRHRATPSAVGRSLEGPRGGDWA